MRFYGFSRGVCFANALNYRVIFRFSITSLPLPLPDISEERKSVSALQSIFILKRFSRRLSAIASCFFVILFTLNRLRLLFQLFAQLRDTSKFVPTFFQLLRKKFCLTLKHSSNRGSPRNVEKDRIFSASRRVNESSA